MATTQDYLNQLQTDKANLVVILNNKGVEASDDETFTSLVQKVRNIGGANDMVITTFQPLFKTSYSMALVTEE